MKVFGAWRDWAAARRDLSARLRPDTVVALSEAYEFAGAWHADQVRPAGEPYVWHLLEVLEIAYKVGRLVDPDSLRAALLHDVVEDTPVTAEQVKVNFGASTAELVGWLTKPAPAPGQASEQLRARYLERFASAPPAARLIKLADRYSNVQRLDTHPRPAKRRAYYLETREHFLPLAAATPAFAELFDEWDRTFAHLAQVEPREVP
ncbi:HD domain-containing protein [Pseudonocardia acaciae]|uniref:HD domain-containing protein n=1 Tax=Pseudonocardia acaciae TaxID=551276 RepID=UPI00048C2A4E|nr:HD domain-containing protein [Pseudonocardia acaciae]